MSQRKCKSLNRTAECGELGPGLVANVSLGGGNDTFRPDAVIGFGGYPALPALLATDLAGRGIDLDGVSHVVNFDTPHIPEDYIHRIGRTGRAENPGEAISLVSPQEMDHFQLIQKKMGKHVKILHGDQLDLQGY